MLLLRLSAFAFCWFDEFGGWFFDFLSNRKGLIHVHWIFLQLCCLFRVKLSIVSNILIFYFTVPCNCLLNNTPKFSMFKTEKSGEVQMLFPFGLEWCYKPKKWCETIPCFLSDITKGSMFAIVWACSIMCCVDCQTLFLKKNCGELRQPNPPSLHTMFMWLCCQQQHVGSSQSI